MIRFRMSGFHITTHFAQMAFIFFIVLESVTCEDCELDEHYCPDRGCISTMYRCDGCLSFQKKCPDGSCKFSYQDCLNSGGCGLRQRKCPDGRCVILTELCDSHCRMFQKECPDGRCINFLDECDDCPSGQKKCPFKDDCVYDLSDCYEEVEPSAQASKNRLMFTLIPLLIFVAIFSFVYRYLQNKARSQREAEHHHSREERTRLNNSILDSWEIRGPSPRPICRPVPHQYPTRTDSYDPELTSSLSESSDTSNNDQFAPPTYTPNPGHCYGNTTDPSNHLSNGHPPQQQQENDGLPSYTSINEPIGNNYNHLNNSYNFPSPGVDQGGNLNLDNTPPPPYPGAATDSYPPPMDEPLPPPPSYDEVINRT